MGAVYPARLEEDADGLLRGQVIAVKVFQPALLGREQLVARLPPEGRIDPTRRHVNALRTSALGATPVRGRAVPYLVREQVEGEDLGRRIARGNVLPERLCRRPARGIARGLAASPLRRKPLGGQGPRARLVPRIEPTRAGPRGPPDGT